MREKDKKKRQLYMFEIAVHNAGCSQNSFRLFTKSSYSILLYFMIISYNKNKVEETLFQIPQSPMFC
ncbi:MAG TPA: hypothetical protein DCG49_05915 [Ruminococcus sp.]|nr:hypothetical protein [Ruminococcus sp.]